MDGDYCVLIQLESGNGVSPGKSRAGCAGHLKLNQY
jgi:hypothetical protein